MLQATVATKPAHGTLSLQPDGAFIYTPASDFSGTDGFSYRTSDGTNLSAPVTVTITVTALGSGPGNPGPGAPGPGANGALVATADSYTVLTGTALTVPAPGVLTNDSAAGSPSTSLRATAATAPAHGGLALKPDGSFTYSPNGDFFGTDTFTYRASDGSSQSAPATVSIVVLPTECGPRPRVKASPAPAGDRLLVRVEATPLNTQQPNTLKQIRFGAFQNARVTLNGQAVGSGQTVTPPANASAVDFSVERVTPGQATTVPLTVVDGCGEWPTFVGGGTGAGF